MRLFSVLNKYINLSIFGRYPLVRLVQFIENPRYFVHFIGKNIYYRWIGPSMYASSYADMTFLSGAESMRFLIAHGANLARFSDGEIDIICGAGIYPPDSDWSQRWSSDLAADLRLALMATKEGLLICVDPPAVFLAPRGSKFEIPFEYNMWIDARRILRKYLQSGQTYGHAHLFTPSNCPDLPWTEFWDFIECYNVVVATGGVEKIKKLQFPAGVRFLECGKVDAYERLGQIESEIFEIAKTFSDKNKKVLVLASLGPSAAILAHRMTGSGIVVWDTGHIYRYALDKFAG